MKHLNQARYLNQKGWGKRGDRCTVVIPAEAYSVHVPPMRHLGQEQVIEINHKGRTKWQDASFRFLQKINASLCLPRAMQAMNVFLSKPRDEQMG